MIKESKMISVIVVVFVLLSIILVTLLFYFMVQFGRDDLSVYIVSNVLSLLMLAVLGSLYFLRKREIGDDVNELAKMKKKFRDLFLIFGSVFIFVFLGSIWVVS